ncbi:MAG: hypothetical protein JNL10_08650 [Verrucomicrobiales bacterium]|nr:hypothetical protein [Verrucomicrobiales bacterium]
MSLLLLWGLLAGVKLGSTSILADPVSQPYLGTPFPVPGRIEVENWDLGGEGVGYHASGDSLTNKYLSPRFRDPQGNPGEAIPIFTPSSDRPVYAVLQTGEWLQYTFQCESEGMYTLLLKTWGPPLYVPLPDGGGYSTKSTLAYANIELDGRPLYFPTPVQWDMILTRVELSKGLHTLRLVAGKITDARGVPNSLPYALWGEFESFTISLDWIELRHSPSRYVATPLTGNFNGYRDGVGTNAEVGGRSILLGQRSSGEVVFFDPPNECLRLLAPDGEIRTLAGFPRNQVRDGLGTEAGFQGFLTGLLLEDDSVAILEMDWNRVSRVRTVSPAGAVSTLYEGQASITLPNGGPDVPPESWFLPVDRPVQFRHLATSGSGEIRAVGTLDDFYYWPTGGSLFIPGWLPFTRYVWFQFANGLATIENPNGPAIPTQSVTDLGDGVRYEWNGTGHLRTDVLPGFPEDLFPGIGITSFTRTREGVLFAVVEYGRIHRLDPEHTLARLSVQVTGSGEVTGVPEGYVPKGTEITVTAIPRGRFSVFEKWSDGFEGPTRTLRLDGSTTLTAEFAVQSPGPSGIPPGSIRLLPGRRSMQFALIGDPLTYSYALEQSSDLLHWTPLANPPIIVSGNAWGTPEQFHCRSLSAQILIPILESGLFLRARLLP